MLKCKYSLIAVIIIIGQLFGTVYACEVAINDVAVWSSGNVNLGTGVTINGITTSGKGVNVNNYSSLDSIYTQGSVWLGYKVNVDGSITANGQVQKDPSAKISGTTDIHSNFVLPPLDSLQRTTIGKDSISTSKDVKKTLLPGDYSNWSFDRNNTISLSTGNYSVSGFWISNDGVVNVDTSKGDVVLNVNGSFSTGTGVTFNKTGNGNFYVNVIGSTMYLNNDVSLTGIVKVSGGFSTGTSVNMTGQVFATGDIWFGNNSNFTYQNATSIPEPSSMAILVVMSLFFISRRRGATSTKAAA
jgi:hypothetical protein